MELTILLSKVFGIYLLIGGLSIWLRKSYFTPILGAFAHDPLMRMVVATLEIVGGLFIILTHNVWTSAAASLVSLMGWLLFLEGTAYMFMSNRAVERMYKKLDVRAWYTFGGITALLIGMYLVAYGFGWLS